MNTNITSQLIMQAHLSKVTSNSDKHLMLKAAQEIQRLQTIIKNYVEAVNNHQDLVISDILPEQIKETWRQATEQLHQEADRTIEHWADR